MHPPESEIDHSISTLRLTSTGELITFTTQEVWPFVSFDWSNPTLSAKSDRISFSRRVPEVQITTGEFPPYSSRYSIAGGFYTHVIALALASQGLQANFTFMPWRRAYNEAAQSHFDATSFWAESPDYHVDFLFAQGFHEDDNIFYCRADLPFNDWSTFKDFRGLTIGVSRGYTYTESFWEAAEKKLFITSPENTDIQNFRKLAANRIDCLLISEYYGRHIEWTYFNGRVEMFKKLSTPLASIPSYLLIARGGARSQKLKYLYNRGIKILEKNGTLARLRSRLRQGYYDVNVCHTPLDFNKFPRGGESRSALCGY
ncbi:hypothetical protein GCM10007877_03470 [Marinibactrum halimedae]|uniref:Solute-binding protein family 3/N-terminal domain-containing protein n=2 Tax=Marinibactrum halimedae TaxID=1444977 RepID=A0AA37WK64_9GAMM|nr:hypothetical protein GCM10007877_03470 [Marinibactrum halimedae]